MLDDEGSASASASASNSAILPKRDGASSDNEFTNTELHAALEKKRILKLFVYTAKDDVFTAKVKSVLKLNMVASLIEIGVSFRQPRRIHQTVKEQTDMGHLGSVSDGEVAQLCRIVCAINLQYLKELFKKLWALSLDLMLGTMQDCHTLTSVCDVFSKVTFRICTYWLSPCVMRSDTLVSSRSI